MKLALWNCYEDFNYDNSAFDPKKFTLSDGLNYWMILLRERLKKLGHELTTPDQYPLGEFDGFIFVDFPQTAVMPWILASGKPVWLILFENRFIKPENYDRNLHLWFNRVFTWSEELADCDKYRLVKIPQNIPDGVIKNPHEKLASMVACNKSMEAENDLYKLRKCIIDHMTTYYMPEFDLYGVGWGEEPCYRGYIPNKREAISRYKFNFCLENVYGEKGYLTEKLFDAMFAGTIPVYLGEPNIRKILPKNTAVYIDDYVDLSDMGVALSSMTDTERKERLNNIEDYVKGDKIQAYSAERFVDALIKEIV